MSQLKRKHKPNASKSFVIPRKLLYDSGSEPTIASPRKMLMRNPSFNEELESQQQGQAETQGGSIWNPGFYSEKFGCKQQQACYEVLDETIEENTNNFRMKENTETNTSALYNSMSIGESKMSRARQVPKSECIRPVFGKFESNREVCRNNQQNTRNNDVTQNHTPKQYNTPYQPVLNPFKQRRRSDGTYQQNQKLEEFQSNYQQSLDEQQVQCIESQSGTGQSQPEQEYVKNQQQIFGSRKSSHQSMHKKQIKYLGLIIERDVEHVIDYHSFLNSRPQTTKGEEKQFKFNLVPVDSVSRQYIPTKDKYMSTVKKTRALCQDCFENKSKQTYMNTSRILTKKLRKLQRNQEM